MSNLIKGRTAYNVECDEQTAYPARQDNASENVLYGVASGTTSGGLVGDIAYLDEQQHIEDFFNRDGFVVTSANADERIYYTGAQEGLPVCISGRVLKLYYGFVHFALTQGNAMRFWPGSELNKKVHS